MVVARSDLNRDVPMSASTNTTERHSAKPSHFPSSVYQTLNKTVFEKMVGLF